MNSNKRSQTSVPTQTTRTGIWSIRRIVVPLDFSGQSRQALPHAIAIAEKFQARITLLHIIAPRPVMGSGMEMALPDEEFRGELRAAEAALQERARSLIPPQLSERSIVKIGHPAAEILDVSRRVDADLIVLTTHGRSGVKRFFMGSTAEQIVRHAQCPVLVVRRRDKTLKGS